MVVELIQQSVDISAPGHKARIVVHRIEPKEGHEERRKDDARVGADVGERLVGLEEKHRGQLEPALANLGGGLFDQRLLLLLVELILPEVEHVLLQKYAE